jgi:glycerophosphoryl diester phosphodiesterase
MGNPRLRPLVLGHRGYRARYPENTLLAFREALAAGADGIECDLQKSVDGRYVVIHDAWTGRVAGTRLEVGRARLADLRFRDLGSGERIPVLEELLEALPPEAFLDIELKEETLTPEDCDGVSRIIDTHRGRRNLMISSFEPRLLAPFRAKGFDVGLLIGEEAARLGFRGLLRILFRLRPQFLNLPVEIIRLLGRSRALLVFRILRIIGVSLVFWTVNSSEDAELLARHARLIVTDEVERIVEALRERG